MPRWVVNQTFQVGRSGGKITRLLNPNPKKTQAASLAFDREHKGSLYARACVLNYWIVNLVDRVLEIYRDPTPSAEAPYVWRFSTRLRLGAAEVVTPLATPEARISVTDLLP